MARAATTLDPFNAIAEPKRRLVLGALAAGGGELTVNALTNTLGWPQPQVSKHLAVLRQVNLVSVTRRGRERMYRVNGEPLRSIHYWTKAFEQFWEHQLGRIKDRAEAMANHVQSPSKHPKETTQ
ncbi:MAG: metalloregulator ArsR/SmtB family transcription factor [Tepidisphaera sp.]|nr:metalloregulator ArsR/SmtB family transcription factor [Tepidisphaera sp.]